MRLTSFTDYSLRTLIYLAVQPDRFCTVKEVAQAFNLSQNHMIKVVHNLSKENYILSRKGKGGGICLAKDPSEIGIGEVVRVIEEDLSLAECFQKDKNQCLISDCCELKKVFFKAREAFFKVLDSFTLKDVCANKALLMDLLSK